MRISILLSLVIVSLFYSCSGGIGGKKDLVSLNAPKSAPVQVLGRYLLVLDENGEVWQKRTDIRTDTLRKLDIPKAYSIHLDDVSSALGLNSECYYWNIRKPEDINVVSYDTIFSSPIVKISNVDRGSLGTLYFYLLADGSLHVKGAKSDSKDHGYKIDLSKFKDVADFVYYDQQITVIDKSGDVFISEGGYNWNPVKYENVSNASKLYASKLGLYVVTEDNIIYRMKNREDVSFNELAEKAAKLENFYELQKLADDIEISNFLGSYVWGYRIGDKEGNNYLAKGKKEKEFKIIDDAKIKMLPQKSFGAWTNPYSARMVVLELDSTLNEYHYNSRVGGNYYKQKIENPKRLGNFKVDLSYYKE